MHSLLAGALLTAGGLAGVTPSTAETAEPAPIPLNANRSLGLAIVAGEIRLAPVTGSDAVWVATPAGDRTAFVNQVTGECLAGQSPLDGLALVPKACSADDLYQHWQLKRVGVQQRQLVNASTGKCATVDGLTEGARGYSDSCLERPENNRWAFGNAVTKVSGDQTIPSTGTGQPLVVSVTRVDGSGVGGAQVQFAWNGKSCRFEGGVSAWIGTTDARGQVSSPAFYAMPQFSHCTAYARGLTSDIEGSARFDITVELPPPPPAT
ncbi:RICIN domain-containing protein [Longispora albida]|uniref:RICIN domain-containing protein n=1 Tax=Longispora albida TaxID=203523 RepID=UPI0012FCE378|nr:hypothetical protein [Longispora albida]